MRARLPILSIAAVCLIVVLAGYVGLALAYTAYSRAGSTAFPVSDGFESGDLRRWSGLGVRQLCCAHAAKVVTDQPRQGRYALRVTLNRADENVRGSKRAEFRLKSPDFGVIQRHAFSSLLPGDWPPGEEPVTLAQWHNVPDRLYGEGAMSPPLRLLVQGGQFMVVVRWDAHPLSRHPLRWSQSDQSRVVWQGSVQPGTWDDWVFDIRWSWHQNGLLRVWRNGQLIVNRAGPNAYNDKVAPYFKFGLYVPGWSRPDRDAAVQSRSVMFDQVEVGPLKGFAVSAHLLEEEL